MLHYGNKSPNQQHSMSKVRLDILDNLKQRVNFNSSNQMFQITHFVLKLFFLVAIVTFG